ncbi:MAG: DUF378 domain-containing protein [Alphaproteobacteria bacterium]|nr:DUF378 domain-containing protein [Alphaproteobacteria bacterium]
MVALLHYLLKTLSLIGDLNWCLVGFFKFDLVAWIFGPMTIWSRLIYAIIGVSALIWAFIWMFSDDSADNNEYSRRRN